jgi:hypothetical protein
VGGHRVDERVRARVHTDLRRHLDLAGPLRPERRIEDLDHVETGEPDGLHVRAAQVAEGGVWHRRSLFALIVSRTASDTDRMIAGFLMLGLLAFAVGYLARRMVRARRRNGSWALSGLRETLVGGVLIAFCAGVASVAPTAGIKFMALAALVMVVLWMIWDEWAPEWEGLWNEEYQDTDGPVEPAEHDLPSEYRFGDRPDWLVPAVAAAPFGILFTGGVIDDGRLSAAISLGLATVVIVVGVTVVYVRRHFHQREIIASVEARARTLEPGELRELVERLEAEHGRVEMRRLRRLLR